MLCIVVLKSQAVSLCWKKSQAKITPKKEKKNLLKRKKRNKRKKSIPKYVVYLKKYVRKAELL